MVGGRGWRGWVWGPNGANDLVRCHRTPQDAALYMADIGLEIGHAMVQLEMLALDLGLVPEKCMKLGLKTTWERYREFWNVES